jgi:flagellar basal body-associated protein FliL
MAQQPAAAETTRKPRSKVPKTALIVVGVALAEAAGFFVIFKLSGGGPAPVQALASEPSSQPARLAEVSLVTRHKVDNYQSGRPYRYDMDISVLVPQDRLEEMKQFVERRSGEMQDRINLIIRGATDDMLREDDLRAVRRQLEAGLREVTGSESLIHRVLIPRFMRSRAD